ncbi:hypothetical protein yc1106_08098 [Curvularia clavata]|uniref:BZIP domain-containing protein n=1 Tax=Curvularia clavata TaxID=95742 RepID=A0A9Q8ZG36_CURCL|nr:hypothetical protein yc1106_08098 [Curvularia clavata]
MARQEEDEDWRILTDANERRRVQNRIAQRNYRRNIKRRLQQLEVFNRSLSENPSTPKDKQQSCQTPPKDSRQLKQTRRDSVVLAAPNAKLPSLEPIHVPAARSSDESSAQSFLFSSTEEIEDVSSMSNQDKGNIVSQQKSETTTVFDLATPLTDLDNEILMFKAVIRGRDSIAKLLVENGADVYIIDDYGNNILHLAAQFGHVSLVSFALLHCVDVNAINAAGETPLHVAIEHDFVEIVDMLIRAGADMEFKS